MADDPTHEPDGAHLAEVLGILGLSINVLREDVANIVASRSAEAGVKAELARNWQQVAFDATNAGKAARAARGGARFAGTCDEGAEKLIATPIDRPPDKCPLLSCPHTRLIEITPDQARLLLGFPVGAPSDDIRARFEQASQATHMHCRSPQAPRRGLAAITEAMQSGDWRTGGETCPVSLRWPERQMPDNDRTPWSTPAARAGRHRLAAIVMLDRPQALIVSDPKGGWEKLTLRGLIWPEE